MKNQNLPVFPGVSKPSSDFAAVRSELRAPPMYRDVSLATARSLTAGTAETLTLVGNTIYIDQKGNSGYATIHVQDDATIGNTPITVFPGFLARLPFTQIILENDAQPGVVLRIIYGTDMDFIPVPGGGVSVLNAINVNDVISSDCQTIIDARDPIPIGFNAYQLIAPAANLSGFNLRSSFMLHASGAGGSLISAIVAAAAAPAALVSSADQVILLVGNNNTGALTQSSLNPSNRRIPAGWGLWHCGLVAVAVARSTAYLSLEFV